ncbi:MAG: protein-L-isoaspartate O-methyltransferase family protein, partial [Candidatus Helarchaeota archaeon]
VIMLEHLDLKPKDNLLILGSKSGYISSIAAHLCSEGEIFILEAIEEIVNFTKTNLKKTGFGKNITIIHQNPLFGLKESAPWQKILVTGQVMKEDLDIILDQLDSDGGVLFAPIGDVFQQKFTKITRKGSDYFYKTIGDVVFGPLDIEPYTTSLDYEEPPPDFSARRRMPLTFKLDLDEADEKIKEVIKDLILGNIEKKEPEKGKMDYIIKKCEELALNQGGIISLLSLSDLLDLNIEVIEAALQKSKRGTIKKLNPTMLLNAIFIMLTPENLEKIDMILEILNKIKDNLISMKTEVNAARNIAVLKKITELIDKLEGFPEFNLKIKKIKSLLTIIQSKNITLQRIQNDMKKENISLMEKYTTEQFETINEILSLIRDESSLLKNL